MNPRNDQAALDAQGTLDRFCENHPDRVGLVRAWRHVPEQRNMECIYYCDECGTNEYVNFYVAREKDKFYYGADSKYPHNSEFDPGSWDGRNGITKERK